MIATLLRLGVLRPYFDIYLNGALYMRRWWLRGDDKARDAGAITAGVHHIILPDIDRDHHNHPCTFISAVLWGWYRERLPRSQHQHPVFDQDHYVEKVRRAGSIALRRASDRHSISEVAPGGAWTLVIWFRKQGSWGFWTSGGFVPHREYDRARRRS